MVDDQGGAVASRPGCDQGSGTPRLRVNIVPHTHWDREWYAPFETFRARLVVLLDELLALLEADPGYRQFLLDGQLAVVDDYLAVRPEAEARLRHLVGSGRVAVGPWYTLPDEFCVSGETLVRDLQLGLERGDRLGGALAVGYLPDMFGHAAQMPQLLRLAGFDQAVVWRGVPSAVDRTAFWWASPDGSTVLAEYLWDGYFNGSSIADDPAALVERLRRLISDLGPALHGDLLFMNGTDHERPQPRLGRVVAAADRLAGDLDIAIVGLADALATSHPGAGEDSLPHWAGELRSGARANLLMGVVSNRVDVKQAAAAAERALERVAEPLCALWSGPRRWPEVLLADAWLAVVRNAAHDSCCACSADEVCTAVLARYRSALHTAASLTEGALEAVAALPADPGLVVVNPTARSRGGVIEVEGPAEGLVGDAQVIEQRPAVLDDRVLDPEAAGRWLERWRSQQLAEGTYLQGLEISDDGDTVALTLHAGDTLTTNVLVPAIRDDVCARLAARPGRRLHLRTVGAARRRILCRVERVPGFGWSRWEPRPMTSAPVRLDAGVLTNGLVSVAVDAATATFSIDGVVGLGRIVESGDHGDTYNYCPPDHDAVVCAPDDVIVSVLESGPVRAMIRVTAAYTWPAGVDDATHSRFGAVPTTVTTVVELRAGERWVRVHHAWDNRSRDHRVRALLPLPHPATASRAECAFAVVTRGLRGEGGPTERPMATFPSRRFVCAGGLTTVHDGLLEYELTDADGAEIAGAGARIGGGVTADALALTLLRSTGMLSRVDLPYRPLPAGPPLAVPAAQLQGPAVATYAVSVDPGVDPYAMADEVLVPLLVAPAPGGGPVRSLEARALVVEGAEVSAVVREAGALTVRIHNPSAGPMRASLPGATGWLVDLRGRPLCPFSGGVDLQAWQIATLRIDEPLTT